MTKSCFLIQFIDKDGYNGISSLTQYHKFFTLGRTMSFDEKILIQNIEPENEVINIINRARQMISDHSSLWIGFDITPKENFPDNYKKYKELRDWVWNSIHIMRFIVNWNLKVRISYFAEWKESKKKSNCSIQETLDPFCDYGSNFHVKFNKSEFFFLILEKLQQYKPSVRFNAILYNYINSKKGKSVEVDYFYEFAVLEGIISNWADEKGYSELWGNAIATPEEQQNIHEKMQINSQEFLNNLKNSVENNTEGKINQLESYLKNCFPNQRKIRRSLKQRFLSYKLYRLDNKLRNNEVMNDLKKKFFRIYSRRNSIGHSLEGYGNFSGFAEDSEILSSAIKILMDFEIENFIKGEIDWKFEERENNLKGFLRDKTQEKILDKFIYTFNKEEQNNAKIQTNKGFSKLKKVEFLSYISHNDEDEFDLCFKRKLKIWYPEDFKLDFHISPPENSRMIKIDDKPDCIIYSTKEKTTNIIHLWSPPANKKTKSSSHGLESFSVIDPENIRTIIKLENVEIPSDFDLFNEI
jgi:hypothetical protein